MKPNRAIVFVFFWIFSLVGMGSQPQGARAAPMGVNGYDLVNAVNDFRSTRGLQPLALNGTLTAIAQAHSEYQASTKQVTHSGANGSRPYDRAVAAGYGGGARVVVSENIAAYLETTPNILSRVINTAWADDLHMNTMLNPNYVHIGGGAAVNGGVVYFTIDVGWISGSPWVAATSTPGGTPATRAVVTAGATQVPNAALFTSTPLADGSVYHVVGYGQLLINIASAYGLQTADIAAINPRLTPDKIFAGDKLLIRQAFTPTVSSTPTITASPTRTTTRTPPPPILLPVDTMTPIPTQAAAPTVNFDSRQVGIVLVIVCGLGALLLVSMRKPKSPDA